MTIPSAVRATVLGRLHQLGTRERDVVMCASVIGRCFDLSLLAIALTHSETQVRADVESACRLDLVVAEASPERYAFRHALTRDIIYAEVLATRMRPVHRRIVRALERMVALGDASLAQLAYHSWAAGDARRALRYNERLGDESAALDARQDAALYFSRARSFLPTETLDYLRLTEKLGAVCDEAPPEIGA